MSCLLKTDSHLFSCFKKMESDEHLVYRLCLVTFPTLFEVVDYESAWAGGQIHNELPKFKGSFSYLTDTTIVPFFKPLRGNFSLIKENEFGTRKKDGALTGCYRSIRDNESDISLVPREFPTIDYDKVDPYQVLMEYSIKIMSAYESKTEADYSFNDFILTSMKSFDRQTWFAVLVMACAFFGLWMTKITLFPDNNHVSLRKRIAEALWDTLLLFISQESSDYYKFLDRLLSVLMTLSFFFLTNIYFGLMSTDLVTVVKPTVINSYQDIMNQPNITLVFSEMIPDTKEFEDAHEDDDGSIQAKFWAKYKDTVEMLDPNSAPVKMIGMMQEALDLKRVLISNGVVIDGARRMMCQLKIGYRLCENVYTWISTDPDARMHKMGWILRNGMKQTRQLRAFRRKIRSMFESGTFHDALKTVTRNGFESTDQLSFPSAPHSKVEKCLSDQVLYADASVDTVVMQNFQFLFALLVVMFSTSTIVLLMELYCHGNHQVGILEE